MKKVGDLSQMHIFVNGPESAKKIGFAYLSGHTLSIPRNYEKFVRSSHC